MKRGKLVAMCGGIAVAIISAIKVKKEFDPKACSPYIDEKCRLKNTNNPN